MSDAVPCAENKACPGLWEAEAQRTENIRKYRESSLGQVCLLLSYCETPFTGMLCVKWSLEMGRVVSGARQSMGDSRQQWGWKEGMKKC